MNQIEVNRTTDDAPVCDAGNDEALFKEALKNPEKRAAIISILESAGLLPL